MNYHSNKIPFGVCECQMSLDQSNIFSFGIELFKFITYSANKIKMGINELKLSDKVENMVRKFYSPTFSPFSKHFQ